MKVPILCSLHNYEKQSNTSPTNAMKAPSMPQKQTIMLQNIGTSALRIQLPKATRSW
jgi:hypothetical protein